MIAVAETELITGTLAIEVRGEVVASNAAEFREMVRAALTTINRTPATDEEFGRAEQDVKSLGNAEKAVRAAKEKALADASSLHALFATLDETSEEIRAARLELEKQIAARKAEVRAEYLEAALDDIAEVDPMVARRTFWGELEAALKGKRTLDSIRKSLDVATKTINGRLNKSRAVIAQFEKAHGVEMIPDRKELELRSAEHVEGELRRRLEAKRAKEEAGRLREETAKANAAAASARAEADANAQAAKGTIEATGTLDEPAPFKLPDPPKIGSLPTGPSPLAEWTGFMAAVMGAFKPLKEAKAALRHPENQAKAQQFAEAVNAAWLSVKGGAA